MSDERQIEFTVLRCQSIIIFIRHIDLKFNTVIKTYLSYKAKSEIHHIYRERFVTFYTYVT